MAITLHSERFVRQNYLSISPTSTTMYSRTFDTLKCKFLSGRKINHETGEISETEFNLPPKFEKHKGILSKKGKFNLVKSVNTLISLVNPDIHVNGKGKENITFCTLTLPSPQIKTINSKGVQWYATDNQIKSECYNQFMTELREADLFVNYVMRAEKQDNGSIHFHILFDKRIDYILIRETWNRIINHFGFVDRYANKMRKLSKAEYIKLRLSEKSKKSESERMPSILKAWEFGKQTNWTQPNSTDIQSLKTINNVAAYISKYMSKGDTEFQLKETDFEAEKQFKEKLKIKLSSYLFENYQLKTVDDALLNDIYQIKGRIWSCSQDISKAKKCITELDFELKKDLENIANTCNDVRVIQDDRFTCILHTFKHLKNYAQKIYSFYCQHIKYYLRSRDSLFVGQSWVSFIYSLQPLLPIEQNHFLIPKPLNTQLNLWQN